MQEIKISAKAFAEFVVGGPTKQSSTVRAILKPKSPEAQIPSSYYKSAIGIIRAYHDQNNDSSYIAQEIKILSQEALSASTPQARAKRLSNMRAIELYLNSFSHKKWKVIPCPRIHYRSSDVRISGTPDLAVQDSDRVRLVKLGVRKEKETPDMVRIMLRVIYQAAKTKLEISPQDITYFDVKNGEIIDGESADRHLASTIETGCQVLQKMVIANAL